MARRSQPSGPSSEPPAMRRWLNAKPNEDPWNPLAGLFDRKKYYGSKKTQLSTVQEEVSRRETSSPGQFPFLCAFEYVGCDQKFENIREWKDHMISRHLGRIFWECTTGDCAHAKCLVHSTTLSFQSDCPEDWAAELPQDTYSGRLFENKDDFRTHLYEEHLSDAPKDADKDADKYIEWLLCLQDSSMRTFSGLPQKLGCPMPLCKSMHFLGPRAWDLRLNHAAKHFLVDPQCPGVFGGEEDRELMQWASSGKVAIDQENSLAIARGPRVEDCAKSMADSGYGSMQGTGPPNMAQHTGIPPVRPKSPKKIAGSPQLVPRQTWKRTFPYERSSRSNLGGWAEDDLIRQDSFTLDDQDSSTQNSVPEDPFSVFSTCQLKSSVTSSLHTSVVDSEEEADETTSAAQENAAVMGWFRAWLREWLTPLTQPQGNECGTDQTTSTHPTSQDQTPGSGSNTGTQDERRGRQQHGETKRKRNGDQEGDGSEESPKTQCVNGPSDLQRFACPFYKRNPRKYGQPKWKSCAHPGYKDVRRVK
ncbi:hypothetical protein FSPOR_11078 [Fusarium sporotrichioides]|uniref:C2H2-type domain-containing protein n=1 Tax=Fusarium sporotrichioides TaxID=5514 RepID=A0A395RIA3_FUSSP|nr:hypothetical protein FSPOR_11078 [Fusarium sporotrichioides]